MLLDKLKSDYADALRAHDSVKVGVLRMLVSDIKNKEIELRGVGMLIEEADMVNVLNRALKTRKESAEMYKNAGRDDLYQEESAEIAVIQEYLPKELSLGEIEAEVMKIKNSSNATDFNSLIKLVMPVLKGKADGKLISEVVHKICK